MYQMLVMNEHQTQTIKKNAFTIAVVVLGHLGSLCAIYLMKAPERPPIKKDPIVVHFVHPPTQQQPNPQVETAKVEPKPIEKPIVKPEPIKPIEKVEKIQSVKQVTTTNKVQVQSPTPVIEPIQKTSVAVETTSVITPTETKASVQPIVAVQPSSIVKNVEIGSDGVQWRREPRISIDESELRGASRMVLLMIEADEKGDITAVKILESSGIASLDAKVMRAVRSAKLKPYMENGLAYSIKAKQPFQFN